MSSHHHCVDGPEERNRYLKLAVLSLFTFGAELAAGRIAGSTALQTDALHTLSDFVENIMNALISERARTLMTSDRLRRLGFGGSLILIGISTLFMLAEAIGNIVGHTHQTLPLWSVGVATLALALNLLQWRIHSRAPIEHRNHTHRGQSLHLLADISGSGAAIVGTALAVWANIPTADAWATIGIVGLIWVRMWRGSREVFQSDPSHRFQCRH